MLFQKPTLENRLKSNESTESGKSLKENKYQETKILDQENQYEVIEPVVHLPMKTKFPLKIRKKMHERPESHQTTIYSNKKVMEVTPLIGQHKTFFN